MTQNNRAEVSDALAPCPWHGTADDLEVETNDVGCYWVVCNKSGCGCEGPYAQSEAEARSAWNRRAATAPAGDLQESLRPITMQDVRFSAGEGKLSAQAVLAGVNGELVRRRGTLHAQALRHQSTGVTEVTAALSQSQPAPQHPDDLAVDRFAAAMKAKLKWEREERNRGGWQDMSAEDLSRLLYEHLPKGDPVDVANLSMMLHQNGQKITTVPAQQPDAKASGVESIDHHAYRVAHIPEPSEAGVEEPKPGGGQT